MLINVYRIEYHEYATYNTEDTKESYFFELSDVFNFIIDKNIEIQSIEYVILDENMIITLLSSAIDYGIFKLEKLNKLY